MCDWGYTSLTRRESNVLHEPDQLNDFDTSELSTILNLKALQSKDAVLRKVRKRLEDNLEIEAT